MADLDKTLNSILSDPEAMEQIKALGEAMGISVPEEKSQPVPQSVAAPSGEMLGMMMKIAPMLEAMNEDIYAWLYIPGTDINHPVLQSVRGDNDYYLTHTVDRQEDENGCLFTEYLYSDKDFRVPVTVIYGHRRRSGDMFGQLQTLYAVTGSLEQYSEVIIYLPDRELHYQVFGESEFSDMHIPNHFKRFHNKADILTFLEELKRYHTMTKQFDESVSVTEDDKILILSTCLAQNDDQRFLVLAKLIVITPFEDKDKLSEAKQAEMDKAFESLDKAADLAAVNDELKAAAADQSVAVSDLLDISEAEEGTVSFPLKITLKDKNLDNFVALLHFVDGAWEWVDAEVEGDALTFTAESLSPFAIIVAVDEAASAKTGDSIPYGFIIGAVVLAGAAAWFFTKSRKVKA